MSFLSERTQPVIMADATAGTSYTVATSVFNLATYGCDSLMVVAHVAASTGNGFTMTAQAGATSSAIGGLCLVPGSTASLMTAATTVTGGKVLYLDIKNSPGQFAGIKHTGLGACTVSIVGYPYDSKVQKIPLSASLPTTSVGSYYAIVNPTTA